MTTDRYSSFFKVLKINRARIQIIHIKKEARILIKNGSCFSFLGALIRMLFIIYNYYFQTHPGKL